MVSLSEEHQYDKNEQKDNGSLAGQIKREQVTKTDSVNSAPADIDQTKKVVVERFVSGSESAPADMPGNMTSRELLGARKYRKAEGSYHNLMDALMWREIAQRFQEGDPEILEIADNMEGYCNQYEDLSYSAIMERVKIIDKFGIDLIRSFESLGLNYTQVRTAARLTEHQRSQLKGMAMSAQATPDEVKGLIEDMDAAFKEEKDRRQSAERALEEHKATNQGELLRKKQALEEDLRTREAENSDLQKQNADQRQRLQKYEYREGYNGQAELFAGLRRGLNEALRQLQYITVTDQVVQSEALTQDMMMAHVSAARLTSWTMQYLAHEVPDHVYNAADQALGGRYVGTQTKLAVEDDYGHACPLCGHRAGPEHIDHEQELEDGTVIRGIKCRCGLTFETRLNRQSACDQCGSEDVSFQGLTEVRLEIMRIYRCEAPGCAHYFVTVERRTKSTDTDWDELVTEAQQLRELPQAGESAAAKEPTE